MKKFLSMLLVLVLAFDLLKMIGRSGPMLKETGWLQFPKKACNIYIYI